MLRTRHHALNTQWCIAVIVYTKRGLGVLCDGSTPHINVCRGIDFRTQNIDVAIIFVRHDIGKRAFYACRKHGFGCSERSAVSSVQLHLECGYDAVVAYERSFTERESKSMQSAALHANGQPMVGLARRESEAAVDIFQLLRHIEIKLKAGDIVHVVHPQRHRHRRVCHTGGILHMQLVHGKRQGMKLQRIALVDAVVDEFHLFRYASTFHGGIAEREVPAAAGAYLYGERLAARKLLRTELHSAYNERSIAHIAHPYRLPVVFPYRNPSVVYLHNTVFRLGTKYGDSAVGGRTARQDRTVAVGKHHLVGTQAYV